MPPEEKRKLGGKWRLILTTESLSEHSNIIDSIPLKKDWKLLLFLPAKVADGFWMLPAKAEFYPHLPCVQWGLLQLTILENCDFI